MINILAASCWSFNKTRKVQTSHSQNFKDKKQAELAFFNLFLKKSIPVLKEYKISFLPLPFLESSTYKSI